MTHVVVIGGGISGLSAAYELSSAASVTDGRVSVTVLEGGALGGKFKSAVLDGQTVDVGPDGFLTRRPEATALIAELGATSALVPIDASGAWVVARGKLRRLPSGLAYGVPTRFRDLRTSEALGILGLRGALRASVDLFAPRRASRSALSDRAIGPLVSAKLGRRVVDTLVDPLIGGIHAGRVKDLSAAAVYPPVLAAGQGHGSLMRSLKAASSDTARRTEGPAFMSLKDGLSSMPTLINDVLRERGVICHTDAMVTSIRRGAAGQPRWSVATATELFEADAVVVAVEAPAAAALLAPLDGDASSMLGTIDAASVGIVTMSFRADDVVLPEGTGLLVPSDTPTGDGTYLTTAVSFLDRKWPHLAREGRVLVRASVGRIDDRRFELLDDDDLTAALCAEFTQLMGADAEPLHSIVTRWPSAFPQYRVNHLVRVDGIESAVGGLGGVAVAGASFRGVGIPACIASGRGAARSIRAWLAAQS